MTVESGSASAGATDGKPLARCNMCDFERAGGGGPFKKKCEYITNPLPGQTACIVRRKAPAPKKQSQLGSGPGTQAAIGVRPLPLDDNILKSTFCASLSADTLLSRWEQGLNVKKRHLIAELVMAHRTSADKPRQGEMVFCIDWSLSWGSVYKLNNGKKGIGVVITNGLGVILWEGFVPTQAIDAIATALTKVVSRDGAAFLVGYIDNMPKGAELLKKAGQVDLMGQDQGHFDRRISSITNNFCDQYGSFCVELTECFLEYNAIFHKLVEVRLLRPGGLPPKAKFKLANGSTKCFGKNDCITKQELADLKDPSKGRKFYTIFKDSLPRDYRHPEVMAARLVELYRKFLS
eukprot:jgi/Tetstr1/434729/TSEL_023782.t2